MTIRRLYRLGRMNVFGTYESSAIVIIYELLLTESGDSITTEDGIELEI